MTAHTPLSMLQVSTTKYQMTVLRDDGLYRHIRFKQPGTSIWHFDLVTWPGHLVITGDLEDFHFARVPDMFEFFRSPDGGICPDYWSQKLVGSAQRSRSYSEEKTKQRVYEAFRYAQEWLPRPHAPLWREIRESVLSPDVLPSEDAVRHALMDFTYVMTDGALDMRALRRQRAVFEFTDSWEWDLRDYDWHFLVSLHAIVWGINQYDQARATSDPVKTCMDRNGPTGCGQGQCTVVPCWSRMTVTA